MSHMFSKFLSIVASSFLFTTVALAQLAPSINTVISPPPITTVAGGSCSTGQFATSIGSNGAPTCAYPVDSSPGYASGNYYTSPFANTSTTTITAANTIYAVPVFIGGSSSVSFTKAALNVTAGVASTACELGLYANSNDAPAALIKDLGNVSTVSIAFVTLTGITGVNLNPGWYWLAVGCNGTPTVTSNNGSTGISSLLGWSSSGTGFQRVKVSWTYSVGGLPNPFGVATFDSAANGYAVFLGL